MDTKIQQGYLVVADTSGFTVPATADSIAASPAAKWHPNLARMLDEEFDNLSTIEEGIPPINS